MEQEESTSTQAPIITTKGVWDEQIEKLKVYFNENKNFSYYVLGGIAVILVIIFGYRYVMSEKNEDGQIAMFQAVYYLEKDSLKKALNGDGTNLGLIDISVDYSGTKTGNLANFYIGIAYIKSGKFQDAIDYLNDFSSSDLLIQARAYALLGDAYSELNDNANAVKYYLKAGYYNSNKTYSPKYFMKAAMVLELEKDYAKALEIYTKIKEDFPDVPEANEIEKYTARVETMLGVK